MELVCLVQQLDIEKWANYKLTQLTQLINHRIFTRKSVNILDWANSRSWEGGNHVGEMFKDVRDRSAIMVCEAEFGVKILPAYSPLDIKVKHQLQ